MTSDSNSTSISRTQQPVLEFWFEFASTYSYLTASRIAGLCAAAGVQLSWHPFLLGPIFAEQGWDDSPFNLYPAKGRYMWRDLSRRCELRGLAFQRPTQFPRSGLRAARLCLSLLADTATNQLAPDFVSAVYRANFAEDRDTSSAAVLHAILRDVLAERQPHATDASKQTKQLEVIFAQASEPAVKAQLRENTDHARELGIFGAPSFIVPASNDHPAELFWGDDRLEDAIAFARGNAEPLAEVSEKAPEEPGP